MYVLSHIPLWNDWLHKVPQSIQWFSCSKRSSRSRVENIILGLLPRSFTGLLKSWYIYIYTWYIMNASLIFSVQRWFWGTKLFPKNLLIVVASGGPLTSSSLWWSWQSMYSSSDKLYANIFAVFNISIHKR